MFRWNSVSRLVQSRPGRRFVGVSLRGHPTSLKLGNLQRRATWGAHGGTPLQSCYDLFQHLRSNLFQKLCTNSCCCLNWIHARIEFHDVCPDNSGWQSLNQTNGLSG